MPSQSTIRQQQLRLSIIQQLGGECSKCGFPDVRALEIAGNDPFERHGSGMGHYYKVQKEVHTGRWRVLCANCNAIAKFDAVTESIGLKQLDMFASSNGNQEGDPPLLLP